MLDKIRDFFSGKIAMPEQADETDTERRIQAAACALLIETASIDESFDEVEKESIRNYFKKSYHLTEDEVNELFQMALRELDDTIDLWSFTNLINKHYSETQKLKVMESIWDVIYADNKLSAHEDYLAHKLYKMLGLSHSQFIDAKLKALKKHRNEN